MNIACDAGHKRFAFIGRRAYPLVGGQQIVILDWSAQRHGVRANVQAQGRGAGLPAERPSGAEC